MPHHNVVPRHRRLGRLKFRRQVPVGRFIADFVCLNARLVVELDGSQHGASRTDAARTTELQRRGFSVLLPCCAYACAKMDAVVNARKRAELKLFA